MPYREATPEDGEAAQLSGCWIWTGYTVKGRPIVRTARSNTTAAKAAWERENGPVPAGKQLGSLCGIGLCVRPSHHQPMNGRQIAYRTRRTLLDRHAQKQARVLRARGYSKRRIADMLEVDEGTVRTVLAGNYYDATKEKP